MPPVTESPTSETTSDQSSPEAHGPQGRAYWRSLDHLADTDEFRSFMHREFPAGASELLDSDDRRHFLKIMGASMALAGLGLAGCRRWPEEHIVPFAQRPEGRVPGIPVNYATFQEFGGVARGVLATAYDGRPVKIEGNPDHPTSVGAADLFAQASILDLYDPDRSRTVLSQQNRSDWAAFETWANGHFNQLRSTRGRGLAVLCEATSSPSVEAMQRRFLDRYPDATWHVYEPVNRDNALAGTALAFGAPYRPLYDFAQAKVIVSLDADFLGTHPNAVQNIRNFARGRRVSEHDPNMSRMYAFESNFSLTGANADQRWAVRSSDVPVVAAWIAARILKDNSLLQFEEDAAAKDVLAPGLTSMLARAVHDLENHRSECVVVAGDRQPPEVHMLAHLINAALGNTPARGAGGGTVTYVARRDEAQSVASLKRLVEGPAPDTLLIIGGNPVYNAPADVDFATWLGGVKNSVHLSDYVDETSRACAWHLNRAHYLETWGDGRSWDGTYTLGQPIIEPLFGGRSAAEVLALINGESDRSGMTIVRRTFEDMTGRGDDAQWRAALHDGCLPGPAFGFSRERPTPNGSMSPAARDTLFQRWKAGANGWELVFAPHPTLYDGRFANNGWLQELPDPMTRLTWDNAVLMSPTEAKDMGVETGDMITVTAGGTSVEAPVMEIPGIPKRSVVLHLGGRRTIESAQASGTEPARICTDAGFDFGRLRTSDAMGFRTGATIERARGSYVLATVQDHHAIDVNTVGGRGIQDRLPTLFREADLDEYESHPDFAAHRTHVLHRLSMWEESNLEGAEYAWAMSVDLNSCVGCGACVAACQAENNIPIVGKEQVHNSREMHWMRIDRYFRFAGEDGHYDVDHVDAVALQPVLCMQCENAPCEQVCPVAATVHDEDGLNVMVYNRCVGTRYCSNNCPYKVRRFNYFDYHRRAPRRDAKLNHVDGSYFARPQATPHELERLQLNPEVTVRMRGVMEKCTYCIQRISTAKIEAKNEFVKQDPAAKRSADRVPIKDGTITPACAQTCPAEALVFGDLSDPKSRVSQLHRDKRSYQMLEELNVKARTRYLAKVRNPGASRRGGGGDGHGGGSGGHSSADPADGRRTEDTSHS